MNPYYSSTKEEEERKAMIPPDQTKRAQENCQHALERQRATSTTQEAKAITPSPAAEGLKSTGGNISLIITPQQQRQQRMEENRKCALERKAANEATSNKKRKKDRIPCYRCGTTNLNPTTLCIDWKHTGDIQREPRNPFNQGF
jgi:hypothetical protein